MSATPPRLALRSVTAAPGRAAFAALIAIGLFGIAGPVIVLYRPRDLLLEGIVNPYHVIQYAMFDSRGQVMAHRLLLAGTACAVAFGLVFRRAAARAAGALEGSRWAAVVLWAGLLGFAAASVTRFARENVLSVLFAACAMGVVLFRPAWLERSRGRQWALLCVALVLGATVPGVLVARDLSHVGADELVSIQWHYDYAMGAGDRLAAGQTLFDQVRPSLGFLLPVLLGGWERRFGLLDLGARQDLLRWLALAFLVAALYAYRRHSGPRYALVAIGILLAIPWLHFAAALGASYPSLLYPNQSAWRSMGFVLGPLGLQLVRHRRLEVQMAVLGALGATLVLLNTESGIALAAGLAVFLMTRLRPTTREWVAKVVPALAIAMFSALGVMVAWLAAHRALLGSWPNLSAQDMAATISIFSRGYGGFEMTWDPVAVAMAFHATYVLVWSALARRRLAFRAGFRAAIATSILVWFAYYANRAAAWNLWTLIVLYSFLVVDLLAFSLRRTPGALRRPLPRAFAGVVLGCVVFPHLALTNSVAADDMWSALRHTRPAATDAALRISGMDLPVAIAQEIDRRAALVKVRSAQGAPAILSACSYVVSTVTGVYSPLPFGDAFNEVFTPELYGKLLRSIQEARPPALYFDAPGSLLAGSEAERAYFAKLRRDVIWEYEPVEIADGWEIWERRDRRVLGSSADDRGPR